MAKMTWRDGAEATGLVAIIASLVLLIVEVRENTLAMERQTAVDRAAALTAPFFESDLASITAKILAVNDPDGSYLATYIEVFDLSHEEAILWERHLWFVWEVLEAEYRADGASEKLNNQISILLVNRDNQIYIEGVMNFRFSSEFREYVVELRKHLDEWKKSHLLNDQ
jgi:hypothetical protein